MFWEANLKYTRLALTSLVIMGMGAVSTASAADMAVKAPPPPVVVYNWTGFYIGGDVGGAWDATMLPIQRPLLLRASHSRLYVAVVTAASSPSINPSTFVGGVYAGYNYQSGNVVFGVEGDISSFRLRANANGVFPFPSTPALTFTANTSVSTDWLFTFAAPDRLCERRLVVLRHGRSCCDQ